MTNKIYNGGEPVFKDAERMVLYRCARVALSDGDTFGEIADRMGLSDEELKNLFNKLEKFLDFHRLP